jgi:hypothetical protein
MRALEFFFFFSYTSSMKRSNFAALAAGTCALLAVSCAGLNFGALGRRGDSFSNADAIRALKDALAAGADSACGILSSPDGYLGDALVKILLPPEAGPIVDSVAAIPGGQRLIDDVIVRINRSAEKTVKDAPPIFLKAITDMSVSDGISIVRGDDTAAADYLQGKTYDSLVKLFKPQLSRALDEPLVANVSANDAWLTLVAAYNKAGIIPNKAAQMANKPAPMPEVTADLSQFASEKAISGAFVKISDEEKKIRANPFNYASEFIQKVFGSLKG